MDRPGIAVAALACVFLLLGVMLIPSPGYALDLNAIADEGKVKVELALQGNEHANTLILVGLSLMTARDDTIFIVSDDDNRTMLWEATSIFDHLKAEAQLRQVEMDIRLVQIDALPSLFYGENATIVMFGYDDDMASEAEQWVERGGLLIGFGPHSIPFVGENRTIDLEFDTYEYSEELSEASPVAEALSLDTIAPSTGMRIGSVLENGGEPIGYSFNGMESLALFSMGDGRVLMFSAHPHTPILTSGPDAMASDLFRLVTSGVVWKVGTIQDFTIQYQSGGGDWRLDLVEVPDMRITAFSLEKWETLFASMELS